MKLFDKKSLKKVGLPPGSLIHIGEKKASHVKITIIDYKADKFDERTTDSIDDCYPGKSSYPVTWINIDGIHNVEIIDQLGQQYGIHALVLEDILNTNQSPKIEFFENYVFIGLKMSYLSADKKNVIFENISIIMGKNFILSFQEQEGDVFNNVRERIRSGRGKIRKNGTDYLLYALVDAVVDSYFVTLQWFGDIIEELELELLDDPATETSQKIHTMKREVLFLRRSVWPLREIINGLSRQESNLITGETLPYLRDVYDHTIQIIDTIEVSRDILSGMIDLYLSTVSNRMNEIMQVLTIISTIFIPITFLAGIYGMNFQFMPELNWKWSYPLLILVMIGLVIGMLNFFKRKKWL